MSTTTTVFGADAPELSLGMPPADFGAHAETRAGAPTTLGAGVARVHAQLDALPDVATGEDVGAVMREVDRAIRRLQATRLALVSRADEDNVAARSGLSGTSAWLGLTSRTDGDAAADEVSLASALKSELPATRTALEAGAVGVEHARIIATTMHKLPDDLDALERAQVESRLAREAQRLTPSRLRRTARTALVAAERSAEEVRAHQDRVLRDEEAAARSRVSLTMKDNPDGTVSGWFTVPSFAGAVLRKTIQQMTAPRRVAVSAASQTRAGSHDGAGSHDSASSTRGVGGAGGQTDPGEGGCGAAAADGHVHDAAESGGADWARRSGEAFCSLLEHLPTERLHGKVAATVVVTVSHDDLKAQIGCATLDTGHDLSASEARRVACNAGILPAVLGGQSLPLDLGRTDRFFNEPQRVALATVYDSCAAEGCDRPYAWSELHHEDPWSHGGRTDLRDAVPLCGFHHRRIHDTHYHHLIVTLPDGLKSVRFHLLT